MTFNDILETIRPNLLAVESTLRNIAHSNCNPLSKIIESVMAGGGKRIRPAIIIFATQFHPVDLNKSVLLAAAVEALHTATLIHDDLVDHSTVRRGHPTVNAQWNDGATVLVGDYIFARAARLAAATGSQRVIELFAEVLCTIVDGELYQACDRGEQLPTRRDYYDRIYCKTASLFAMASESSGELMNATDAELVALRNYGANLGMAFQIVDDVLDFVGEQSQLGKTTGNDLRQGILTLPVYYFSESHPEDSVLKRYWNNGQIQKSEIDELMRIILSSSSIQDALAEAAVFATNACDALEVMPDVPARDSLRGIAQFVAEYGQTTTEK